MPQEANVNRREVLKGSALVTGLAAAGLPLVTPDFVEGTAVQQPAAGNPVPIDFTNQSAALQADRIVTSACQFCNSLCGLKVHMRAGRVIDIRGETDDPVQAGEICVKASMMTQMVYNRFRLTRPLRRVGGQKGDPNSKFDAITWEKALDLIARKMLELRDKKEARAVVSRTSGRLPRGTGSLIGRLFTLLGSPNDTDVGPVCNDAGGNALAATFGMGNFTNGYGIDPHHRSRRPRQRPLFPVPWHQPGRDAPGPVRAPSAQPCPHQGETRRHRSAPHADRGSGRSVARAEAAHRSRASPRHDLAHHHSQTLR